MKHIISIALVVLLGGCNGAVDQALQQLLNGGMRPHCDEGWLPTNNGPNFDWAAYNQNSDQQ